MLVGLAVWAFFMANAGHAAGSSANEATGLVSAIGPWRSTLTIQLPGRQMPVITALKRTADDITARDYPYVWAGGHAAAGVASVGQASRHKRHAKTPPVGFDCSGAVAAVLAGGGLWTPGSSVPNDAGVVAELLSAHVITRGAGTGAAEVTLFDKPGSHIFMRINGQFWGTSDGHSGNAAQPHGGAGWLNDGAPDARSRLYKAYHVLPRMLGSTTVYGPHLTFVVPSHSDGLLDGLTVGERVSVSYGAASDGTLMAHAVTPR